MIFVDTGFFFSLLSSNDRDHARVREVFESFKGQRLVQALVTTNHVIAETITLALAREGHPLAVSVGQALYQEKLARIHWAAPEEEKEAFSFFEKHTDKEYSAVDCLSFVVMERLGISEALALDEHFTHRFVARPGPLIP